MGGMGGKLEWAEFWAEKAELGRKSQKYWRVWFSKKHISCGYGLR